MSPRAPLGFLRSAEIEPGRATPVRTNTPSGRYGVRLVGSLTEGAYPPWRSGTAFAASDDALLRLELRGAPHNLAAFRIEFDRVSVYPLRVGLPPLACGAPRVEITNLLAPTKSQTPRLTKPWPGRRTVEEFAEPHSRGKCPPAIG